MKKLKTVGLSILVAVCAACLSLAFVACTGGEKSKNYGAGEEGFYYYDGADSARYMLSLQSGTYMITANNETQYSGSYSYDVEAGEISFSGDTAFTATMGENALSLDMGDSGYSFKAYRYFDVTYVDGNGKTIATESVLNGQSAEALEIEKDGYWFIGWYEDSSNSSEFAFDTSIAGDTTVYGWYIEKNLTATEYEITLDYGDGTVEYVSTMNGAVWNLPSDGILGWWVSDTNKPGELTYKYTVGGTFTSDTTLYAVYSGMGASVTGSGVTWENVTGSNVTIIVYDEKGEQVLYATPSSTSGQYAYDFSALSAGTYTVEVTSGSTTEYLTYIVNGLARVSTSSAEVIKNGNGEVFSFAPVDGAAGYVITVSDGTRTLTEDLGPRTYYNFSGWEMTKEGITFTVTAYATGYVSSVSDSYTYRLVLEGVSVDIVEDEVVWNRAEGALEYEVVIYGEDGNVLDTVRTSDNSYSLKYYDAGTYTISVQPVTDGYYSEASTYYGYAKSTIASPVITDITSYSVTWEAVTGATSYVVSVNGAEYKVEEGTTLVFTDTNMPAKVDIYEISVKAVGTNGNDSSYSDAITTTSGGFTSGVTYYKNTVTWNYDLAAARYEISVNGDKTYTATSGNSQEIELTKAGTNDIVVTAYDAEGRAVGYAEVSVYAYSVTIDGNGAKTEKDVVYVAQGDTLNLGMVFIDHADFLGWYTQADFTMGQSDEYEGNGTEIIDGSTFTGNRDTYIYAYYSYEWVNVKLVSNMGSMTDENGNSVESLTVKIKYNSTSFTLPSASPYNEEDNFDGWNTRSNGNGTKYTTSAGESVGTAFAGETTLYAYFRSVLLYERTMYGGQTVYSVSAGSEIDSDTEVEIPESYKGYDLILNSGAFENCKSLVSISIPDTVLYIATTADGYNSGTGAFSGCSSLEAVNIYATGDAVEPLYFSADGILFHKMNGTENVELLYFPYAKELTTYTVPSYVSNSEVLDASDVPVQYAVTEIPYRVFRERKITEIVIPSTVTYVGGQAFYNSTKLQKVTFAEGGTDTLTLGDELFRLCTNLTEVTLPARYTEFSTAAFDYATSLISVYFEDGGSYKSTTSGVVLDAAGTTVVYYPLGIGGAVDFTTGDFATVTTVGSFAFADNKNITSITISGNVTLIEKSAFDGCSSVSSLEFKGDAESNDLTISARAFYGLTLLREVTLPVNLTTMEADAFGGCTNLTSVYFDARANTTTLNFADGAFGSSSAVTELTLGVNVPEISFAEIFGGSRLAKVTIETATDPDTGETVYNENYFSDDYGVVYNAAKTSVLYYPLARVGEYELLDTTTEITSNVFSSRTGLTAITIPASVNTIADDAFSGCTYLETITVKEGNEDYCSDSYGILYQIIKDSEEDVTKLSDDMAALRLVCCPLAVKYDTLEIGENVIRVAAKAFDGNTVVKSVTFKATTSFEFETAPYNNSTTDFRAYTFNSCTALETVVLPDCMTEISAYAFYYCSALKYVNIPKSCVTIGNSAFRQNKGTTLTGDLTDSENGIVLPEGLQTIEAFAFYYNMHLAVTIPYTVTFIGQQAFGYCWDDTTTQVEIVFQKTPEDKQEVELTLDQYALDYTQYATSVTIPARTVEMGAAVFMAYGQSTTESTVYFEDGFNLTSIGNNVFNAAKSLKTITIPASVTSIEQRAFYQCTSLESIYFAPEGETTSVTTIGNYAFYQTVLTSVEIPASVTSIDYYAFRGITTLESFTFETGSQLATLGYGVFYGDTALETITIPGSVTTITANSNPIFYGCTGLKTVIFESSTTGTGLTVLPYSAFKGCTALTTVTLPDTLLTIGDTSKSDGAFEGCTSLKEITIPSKVETIAPYTFNGCTSLEAVTFESPSSVSSIGNYAFNGCTAMTSFTFPEGDGIEISLGEKIFSGSGVTTVTLTSSVTQLGGAFVDSAITSVDIGTCTSYIVDTTMQVVCSTDKKEISYVLGTITGDVEVPDTVEVIGPSAYSDQTGITSVKIPASVKTISDYAFYGCTSLVTVEIASGSALGEDALGASAFEGCTALTSINLPATVAVIPDSCFKNCDLSMTTVPSAVTEVGSEAFRGTKITSITLSAVTSVGTYAFADTTALGSVTFGNSLTTLGSYAFDNSTALESVNFPASLTKIDSYTFHGCASLADIEIPSNITSIGTYAFSECTGLVSITLPDSLSTLDTYVFRDSTALVSVTIPEGITTLNSGMFWGCSSLEEVILPDGITKIDTYAFYLCESLKTLALPAALTTISDFAFEDSGIETIEFGDALTSIGNYAFLDCPNLLSVLVGRNVTTLGSSVFQRCTALVSANTGDSVTTVNGFMFDGCTSLVSVEFGPAVTSIGSSVLRNCTSLESVTIHNGVTDIGSNAFLGCTSLESIYIPSSISSMGSGAFDGCSCDVFVENTMNYVTSVWTSDWMGTGTGKVYYYSETEPAFNESGTGYADTTYTWWHYDEDENIVIWAFGYTTYAVETEGYVLYDADADTIAYVCLYDESTETSTVYAVTECSGDASGYTVTLENGGSYTIVLSGTTATVTAA